MVGEPIMNEHRCYKDAHLANEVEEVRRCRTRIKTLEEGLKRIQAVAIWPNSQKDCYNVHAIACRALAGEESTCPHCKGTGEIADSVVCERCGGLGGGRAIAGEEE